MSNIRVIAYQTPAEASQAVDHLIAEGVPKGDISVMLSEQTHGTHFAVKENTKGTEGAGIGAAVGGVLGAIGATAVAAAGIAIPGIGFLAAGPIMTALAGLGAGAATGGLIGGLAGLGVPEHEAKLYEEIVKDGGVLVGVSTHDDARKRLVEGLKDKTDPIRVARA